MSDSRRPDPAADLLDGLDQRVIDLTAVPEGAARGDRRDALPDSPSPRPDATDAVGAFAEPLRRVALVVVAIIVVGAAYWLVTLAQVVAATDDDQTRAVDAIVVLGAAQFDGTPSPALAARLDRALELWDAGQAGLVMTTGSNQEGDRFTEGFSGFVYLREAGVPESAILTIVDGADTYQQMTAAQAQLVERDLTSVLLVSDGYHSYRLLGIAGEIGLEAYVAPTEVDASTRDYVRETTAVSIGRILGYRRLSAWNTEGNPPG